MKSSIYILPIVVTGLTLAAHAQGPAKPKVVIPSLLNWEAQGAPRDPVQSVNRKITHIVGDLTEFKTDQPVQQNQKLVVREFDGMIKELEEQMKKGGGSGGANPNPTKPASKSTLAKGPGGSGPLHDPRAGGDKWGQLSAKERAKITQSQTEGFPPGYEAVLASYYNRLAQEKVNAETDTAGPTTRPAKP